VSTNYFVGTYYIGNNFKARYCGCKTYLNQPLNWKKNTTLRKYVWKQIKTNIIILSIIYRALKPNNKIVQINLPHSSKPARQNCTTHAGTDSST
jgi:hypothetical protein